MFTITVEAQNRLICVILVGFWDLPTMLRFEDEASRAITGLREPAKGFDQLINSSNYPVQSQAVIERHKMCAARWLDMGLRRTAIVVADSGLAKLQAGRISEQAHRVFLSEQDARVWLEQPELQDSRA